MIDSWTAGHFLYSRSFTLSQWRIYIEAKEAVLGGPWTQGAPKFTIKKWLRNNDNAERV